MSLLKIQRDYERYGKIAEDVSMRRHIIKDLMRELGVNEQLGITYNDIMQLSVIELKELIERKKHE